MTFNLSGARGRAVSLGTQLFRLVQVVLPITVFALAIPIIVYAAQNLPYGAGFYPVEHENWDENRETFTGRVFQISADIRSPNLGDLSRVISLIVAAAVCSLINMIIVGMLIKKRGVTVASNRKRLQPNVTILVFDGFLVLLTLCVAIYTEASFRLEYIFPQDIESAFHDRIHDFTTAQNYDAISWNCAIWPRVTGASSIIYQRMCSRGHHAIDMMLAVFFLQAVALALHAWFWRNDRKALIELEPEDKLPVTK